MLTKTFRMLMLGAVAALGLCWPAVASVVVDDFEDGNGQNAFGQYWYTYSTYTSGMTLDPLTSATVAFVPADGGAPSGSGKAAAITFSGLGGGAAGEYPEIGIGVGLTAGDDIGFGSEMNKVDSIAFWVKGTNGIKFFFGVQTVENAPAGDPNSTNNDKYGKQFSISGTGWTRLAVALKSGSGNLTQGGFGTAFTFDRTKVTKISWAVKKADNTTGTNTSPTSGTFAVDNIELVGSIDESAIPANPTTPPAVEDLCESCVSATFGPSVPSVLLTDFTSTKNELGYYGYSYKDTISTTTIAEGTAGRLGNGLSVEFTIAGTKTDGRYVGVGVNLSDNDVTTPLDASTFNGIYLEYKTTGLDKVKIEVIDKVGALNPAGKDFYIYLPGTNGEWRSAAIPFTTLKAPSWVTPAPTFNKSNLAKIQVATNVAGSGAIAVDNIYFLGANTFPGQSPPSAVTKYTLTYKVNKAASTEYGGWVSVNNSRDTARVDTVTAGATGPVVTAIPSSNEYRFVTWSDGNTVATRTDVATESKVFAATFVRKYTNTYLAGTGGLLRVNGASSMIQSHVATLSPDSVTTVLAVPDPGYRFVTWDDDKADAERTDGYADKASTFTAIFALIPTDPGTGAVLLTYTAGVGGKIRLGIDGALELAVNRYVEPGQPGPAVTAVPEEGYRFVEWNDGLGEAARTDTPNANMTLSAVFTPITYTVSYTAENGGALRIGDAAEYVPAHTAQVAAGTVAAVITAIADKGYEFVQWSDGLKAAVRMDVIYANLEVKARFQARSAVASPDREIPAAPTAEEAAVAPVAVTAGELTAGPNPTAAAVKFFRTGRTIKTGKLSVYDASGSLVTTLNLIDKGTGGKRTVGSWNLKDTKSRQVANGSYAVKGTVVTKDGAKEKVSTIIKVAKQP